MTTLVDRPEAVPQPPGPGAQRVSLRRELLLVAGLYLVFEVLRDVVPSRPSIAYAHALAVLDLERRAGVDIEAGLQRATLGHTWLVDAANLFYSSAYVVCTVAALVLVARRAPERYVFWRNALVMTTCLGLVGYYLYPTAPPRLLAQVGQGAGFGIVDTLKTMPGPWSEQAPLVATLGNPYAAMPSLHCAWAAWVALAVGATVASPVLRALVLLYPVVTVLVVLVTGNHFVLDVLAGMLAAVLGIAGSAVVASLARARRGTLAASVGSAPPLPLEPSALLRRPG